jgi:transcription factor SPN1
MEDLEMPAGSPAVQNGYEPQGNDDAGDTLRPDVEEENNTGTPPIAEPEADMEIREDDDAPVNDNADGSDADLNPTTADAAVQDDEEGDLESDLEELDEEQFEDFDPSALNIPDKPLMVDETNVGLLGVHKRKRTAEEEAERERKKKKKEKRRERPSKRSKKSADDEDDFEGGVEMDGKRARNTGDGRPGKAAKRARTPEDEENLTPEERKLRQQSDDENSY